MKPLVTVIALAALRRWRTGRDADAIAGDLAEQVQAGRSTAWLVSQVVAAMLVGAVDDVRMHGWSVASGFLGGGAVVWLFRGFVAWPLINLDTWLFTIGATGAYGSWSVWHASAPWLVFGLCYAAAGWLAARIGRGAPGAAVLALAAWTTLTLAVNVALVGGIPRPTPFSPAWMAVAWLAVPLASVLFGGMMGTTPPTSGR